MRLVTAGGACLRPAGVERALSADLAQRQRSIVSAAGHELRDAGQHRRRTPTGGLVSHEGFETRCEKSSPRETSRQA